MAALAIAVNLAEGKGQDRRYLDIDCYGSITGALAGALAGAEALPAAALGQVAGANRLVHAFDLELCCRRLAPLL